MVATMALRNIAGIPVRLVDGKDAPQEGASPLCLWLAQALLDTAHPEYQADVPEITGMSIENAAQWLRDHLSNLDLGQVRCQIRANERIADYEPDYRGDHDRIVWEDWHRAHNPTKR